MQVTVNNASKALVYSHKKLYQSTRRMPRRKIPIKDAEICDKLRGADTQALIRRSPRGETRHGSYHVAAI